MTPAPTLAAVRAMKSRTLTFHPRGRYVAAFRGLLNTEDVWPILQWLDETGIAHQLVAPGIFSSHHDAGGCQVTFCLEDDNDTAAFKLRWGDEFQIETGEPFTAEML